MSKLAKFLDAIYYIVAQVGIFIAAFRGSLIWVCVFGFCLIDGALTQIFVHHVGGEQE